MSVHNSIKYLKESIESILNQTFVDFEFIIIDDGSTDGSTDLLRDYASRDSRIRLYIQENIGLTKSLNRGISVAKSEFIARMDGDDISLPNRLKVQLNFIQKHENLGAIGGSPIYIDEKNRPLFQREMPLSHEEICHCHLTGCGGFIAHPSALIRSEALKQVSGYDECLAYAQDYDLWCRLARNWKLRNLPDALILYRFHQGGITICKRDEQDKLTKKILNRELTLLGHNSPLELKECYKIFPTNIFWVVDKSSKLGYFSTTFYYGIKIYKNSIKNTYFAAKKIFISFLCKLRKPSNCASSFN